MIDDPTAVTTVRRDWAAHEAAAPGLGRELVRLGRRARRRWLRTLGWALAVTALWVGVAALRPRDYASRVVLRVTPAADAGVRDWVASVVLSRAQLARVVGADGAAVERLRGALTLSLLPGRDDSGRSSRLAIAVHGDDAQRVHATVTQLGGLVVAAQPRGHEWAIVEPARVERAASRGVLLGWLALCVFVVALPLCAIAVGAFDPHVYDLDDVRRLGLPALGAIRPFAGDNAGALVARSRDGGRATITR